ncbi:MAG: hypothetical protein IJ622_00890 [Bacteroidales bacterium]|nr:hypothetical protein [Bacteroidales bacterium]
MTKVLTHHGRGRKPLGVMPLKSITLFLANVHIYETNLEATKQLLSGNEEVKFVLNV